MSTDAEVLIAIIFIATKKSFYGHIYPKATNAVVLLSVDFIANTKADIL